MTNQHYTTVVVIIISHKSEALLEKDSSLATICRFLVKEISKKCFTSSYQQLP